MSTQNQEEYSVLGEELSKIEGIIEKSSDGRNVHLITKTCSCTLENSIVKNIDEFNLLLTSPVFFEQGWEYYRVIAFTHEDFKKLLQQFEDRGFVFEVLRKVSFNGFVASSLALTADTLFSGLTEKQIDALLTAYNYGYYLLPRKTDVKTIANIKQVPRTTFQEHLKKAENKIVTSLVPYIQLLKQSSTHACRSRSL